MSVSVKRFSNTAKIIADPIFVDTDQGQRETTVDGQTFHWGPNEDRNFLDDGVGHAHAAFAPGANIKEDATVTGQSTS
jgi:hypothetical protein